MNWISALRTAYTLAATFAPLVPEVVKAEPNFVANAHKVAADLGKHDVTSTVADVEATCASVPADLLGKVLEASKHIKL